jgi:hypothetical protein
LDGRERVTHGVGLGLVRLCAERRVGSDLLALDSSDAPGIKHVLHCHPPVASPHATDENDQLSRMEILAVSPAPQPPPVNDQRIHDLELAVQRQLLDGKALKKTCPRRTADYAGGMGRWALVCQCLNLRYREFVLTGSFSFM